MSCYFWFKSGNGRRLLKCTIPKPNPIWKKLQKCTIQKSKRRFSQILSFSIFTLPIQNIVFPKIRIYTTQHFEFMQKIRYEKYTCNKCAKFGSSSLYLPVKWPKAKTGKGEGDDVPFMKRMLEAFIIVVRQSKWYFWNPKTKLGRKCTYAFEIKLWIRKFYLSWRDIVFLSGLSSPNFTSQIIHKTCVTWHLSNIFTRWPY